MQPIDYGVQVMQPFQAALQGYAQGAAIRDDQQQQQALQAQLAEKERARMAQLQMQQEVAALSANPNASAKDYAALVMKYPSLREPAKQSWEMVSQDRRAGVQEMLTRAYAATSSGRPDIAQNILRERAAAMRNSGDEAGAKAMEQSAELIGQDPVQARYQLGTFLAGIMDPDKFAETFSKLGAEGRAAELQPAAVRKAEADAVKAGADATTATVTAENAPAMAAAKLTQEQADATTKGVTAQYADQKARADLQKMAADLGLTKAQTAQAMALTRKYNADTTAAVMAATNGDPAKKFDAEQKLRKEYTDNTKVFTDVSESYRRILASKDDAVGDLSLIFGYMKMLDPGSVVREGEFATAEKARGVPDTVLNTYNRILRGERLNQKQRESFKAQAGQMFKAAEKREEEIRSGLTRVAESYKLDTKNIFGTKVDQQVPAPAPDANAAPTKINGDADYAKLPSGALFVGPDGKTRRKP